MYKTGTEKKQFIVRYSIQKQVDRSGEGAALNSDSCRLTATMDSMVLNEVFTDLFYQHRYDGLVGLNIESIELKT